MPASRAAAWRAPPAADPRQLAGRGSGRATSSDEQADPAALHAERLPGATEVGMACASAPTPSVCTETPAPSSAPDSPPVARGTATIESSAVAPPALAEPPVPGVPRRMLLPLQLPDRCAEEQATACVGHPAAAAVARLMPPSRDEGGSEKLSCLATRGRGCRGDCDAKLLCTLRGAPSAHGECC